VKVRDRVAVVTGASSGIGAATAVALARAGATVVGVARRAEKLEATIDECRRHAPGSIAVAGDVSSRDLGAQVVREATDRFGRVDILVNNAGISPGEDPVHRMVEDAETIMAVNFFGPVYLTAAALPGMIERRVGSIVNVTSVSGYIPAPGEPAYGASKAALSRWSHGLAVDLHATGLHIGVLSPGPIDTEIWDHEGVAGYGGKLYGPDVVAAGVLRMIEKRLTHLTVPRRFGAMGALYPIAGAPLRWGLRKYATARPH
jgi:short-subunit dehydrogenase